MTKDQIKALVAAKIAGQGSQVDVGGGLPTILNEIIDLIPEGGGGGFEPLVVEPLDTVPAGTTGIYISEEDLTIVRQRIYQGLPTYLKATIHDDEEGDYDVWELITHYDNFKDLFKTDSFTITSE